MAAQQAQVTVTDRSKQFGLDFYDDQPRFGGRGYPRERSDGHGCRTDFTADSGLVGLVRCSRPCFGLLADVGAIFVFWVTRSRIFRQRGCANFG